MAFQSFDFQRVKVVPITEGIEVFGGWVHWLSFVTQVNLAAALDDLWVQGRVPLDEDWQVLQIQVDDLTAAVNPQGWKRQTIEAFLAFGTVNANSVTPQPTSEMVASTQFVPIWRRIWDGATYVQWGDIAGGFDDPIIIRSCDPVFSFHRWPAGMIWRVRSENCEQASGGLKTFVISILALRLPREEQGLDVRQPLKMLDAALRAVQESARREVLRD